MSSYFFENEFGHSPFIGKGGLGYKPYNDYCMKGGVLTLTGKNKTIEGASKILKWVGKHIADRDDDEYFEDLSNAIEIKKDYNSDEEIAKIEKDNDEDSKKTILQIINDRKAQIALNREALKKEERMKEINDKKQIYFLSTSDIEQQIKNIKTNEGVGKKFEKVILNLGKKIETLTNDDSEMINNDTLKQFSDRSDKNNICWSPELKDKSGKVIKWKEVGTLNEFLPYDISQKKADIECKYYCYGTYVPDKNEIKKDGLILQLAKFIASKFMPLFTEVNGEVKLYNVFCITKKVWVNADFIKDVYVLYGTNSGLYSYCINKDNNLKKETVSITGKKGEKLFLLKPDKYIETKDGFGKPSVIIPYNKLQRVNFKK